jgi:3',5'-cyclic-nucleotide phosphodiesterase
MELRVLGCHGGETPRHRTTAFLVDDRLTIDAGSLSSQLELGDQARLETVLVSHSHMDHVRDLASVADTRCQLACPPLTVAGSSATIAALRKHFFNDVLWPDFTVIPTPAQPTIVFREIPFGQPIDLGGHVVTAVPVDHTVESAGFLIDDGAGILGFSGDTGPTERFWQALNAAPNVRALLMEVSFPNREQAVATASGHHTPQTLVTDLRKLRRPEDLPTLLYHIKPPYQAEVEKECARLKGLSLQVLALKDQFVL